MPMPQAQTHGTCSSLGKAANNALDVADIGANTHMIQLILRPE